MAQGQQAQSFLEELEKHAESHQVDIIDVEVAGAAQAPLIRVRIDNRYENNEDYHAITLDEVAEHTGWISEIVEALDPFTSAYHLEVSSPGVDRPLRKAGDFKRFLGHKCEITTTATEGRKKWTGVLESVEQDVVGVQVDGENITLPLCEIKKATLKAELSFKPAKSKGK